MFVFAGYTSVQRFTCFQLRVRCTGASHSWAPLFPDEGNVLMRIHKLECHDGPNIQLKQVSWADYFENGNLYYDRQYDKGMTVGMHEQYYESGRLYISGSTINHKREGKWTWYWENGLPDRDVMYKNGKKDGLQTYWSSSGRRIKEEVYEAGVLKEKHMFRGDEGSH